MNRNVVENEVGGLGFLLDRVAHSLTRAFETELEPFELGASHLAVLSMLHRYGPTLQSRLAEAIGLERQQLVNLINTLERRGAVRRQPVEGDRRAWSVELTDDGRKLRRDAQRVSKRHERLTFGHLDDLEQEQLGALLRSLIPQGRFPHLLADPNRGRP